MSLQEADHSVAVRTRRMRATGAPIPTTLELEVLMSFLEGTGPVVVGPVWPTAPLEDPGAMEELGVAEGEEEGAVWGPALTVHGNKTGTAFLSLSTRGITHLVLRTVEVHQVSKLKWGVRFQCNHKFPDAPHNSWRANLRKLKYWGAVLRCSF